MSTRNYNNSLQSGISGSDFLGSMSRCRQFSFPAGDDYARDAIAQNRNGGAPHVHELINREEKKERPHGQVKRRGCRENNQERCAGDAGWSAAAEGKG